MKERRISLKLRVGLKRRDVHLMTADWLRVRQEVFVDMLMRVMKQIERAVRAAEANVRGMDWFW